MKGTITAIKPLTTKDTIDPRTGVATARPCGGFGFIRDEAGQDRFFNHTEGCREGTPFSSLYEGQAVTFDPYEMAVNRKDNGLRARRVTVVTA